MLQCVAVCCSVSDVVARKEPVCCSVLQCVVVCCSVSQMSSLARSQYVAVCCRRLQCVAVCCSVLHCVADVVVRMGASMSLQL